MALTEASPAYSQLQLHAVKPKDEPVDLSHPKRHNVEQLKKPYLASRNFKPVSNPKNTFILIMVDNYFPYQLGPPPEPHLFSMSTSKRALINLWKAFTEEKPIRQVSFHKIMSARALKYLKFTVSVDL